MAQTSPKGSSSSKRELLSLKDILTVFNNPINEDQAWAVCHQCAQFFKTTSDRSKYREFYKNGARAIRIRPDGEIVIEVSQCDISFGSGKGPPLQRRNSVTGKDIKVVTESDAVQGLGLVIYQALDYGMGASEERHLSHELENLVEFMTNPDGDDEDASTADDEGIEKDAKENGLFPDVLTICEQHLSNEINPANHYRAVCRALVAEAQELCSFLEQISCGKESLAKEDDDLTLLEDLQRNDWARLWVQIMKQLRHGVRLKGVQHTNLTPREYELTPFEVLLEDIRTRRYTLKKTLVNGDIPPKVKSDAHAVILEFIRSRPPLHSVKDRILKSPPKRELDPIELLLQDIRQQPKLRPVKDGKLVVETSRTKLNNDDETESPLPVRKVIKPDFNLLRNFEDDTDESECSLQSSRRSSVASPSPEKEIRPWQRAVVRDLATTQSRPVILQRRNTITVCESPVQVHPSSTPQSPIIEEADEENVFPQKDTPNKSQTNLHDNAVKKIRRQSAVCKSHVSANDVRQRLSLKLHGNTTAMCMSSHDRVHARAHLSSQSSGSSEDLLSESSSQSSPRMRKISEPLLRTYPQKVQRSASVSDMTGHRPQPMTRSRTMPKVVSESETSDKSNEMVRPVPRPRPVPAPRMSRSSSPKPVTSPALAPTNESSPSPTVSKRDTSPTPARRDASPTPAKRDTSPKPVKRHRSSVHRSSTHTERHRHRLNSSEEEQSSEISSDKSSEQRHRSSDRRRSSERKQSSSEQRQRSSERRQRSSEKNQITERKQRTSEHRTHVDRNSELSSVPSTPSTSTSSSVVSSPSHITPDPSPKPSPTPRPRIQRSASHVIKRQLTISGGPVPTADSDQTIPQDSTKDSRKISIRKESSSEFGRTSSTTDSVNTRVPRRSDSSRAPRPMSLIEVDDRRAIIQEAGESSLQTNGATGFSSLDVRDLLNVSSRMRSSAACEDPASTTTNCNGSPAPSSHPSSAVPAAAGSKWSHPIECLSLTLEEVTHIRTVLTKADLESAITQKDLYTLLAKGKICFTCKEVKFSMFGQWGTRCKICKRNVCNNCLRKMNVPTEHFENIPVHTLSPIPLSPETLDIIRAYESTGSVPHSPTTQRKQQQKLDTKSVKPKTLQRANTFTANQGPAMLPNKNLLKGPQMNICRDCKGMIMEIIRTSRTSIALINQGKQLPKKSDGSSSEDERSTMNLSSLSLNVKHFFTPTKD